MDHHQMYAALMQLEKVDYDQLSTDGQGSSRFDAFVEELGSEPLTLPVYFKIEQIYYRRYMFRARQHPGDRAMEQRMFRARVYILLQYRQIMRAQRSSQGRSLYPHLSWDVPVEEDLKDFFIKRYPVRFSLIQNIRHFFFALSCITACLLLAGLVLLGHLSFWTGWFLSVGIGLVIMGVGRIWLEPLLLQDRIFSLRRTLDLDHLKFERKMSTSPAEPS